MHLVKKTIKIEKHHALKSLSIECTLLVAATYQRLGLREEQEIRIVLVIQKRALNLLGREAKKKC